jgi:phosphohistidine swiveling domain-containing protein
VAETVTVPAESIDPVNTQACSDEVAWTTINASEALPGIVTPLTWSFYRDAVERSMRGGFCDLGVMGRDEVTVPSRVEERVWSAFYGRPAANLNQFREMADRMPGSSGDSVEEQIFGQVRDGVENHPSFRRWPIAALKMPISIGRVRKRLRRERADQDGWWRATMASPISSGTEARAQFRDAASRFERVMRPHLMTSIVCQAIYEQLTKLADQAGEPGLERALVTGYGSLDETLFLAELWEVSRGRRAVEVFLSEHGYHGSNVGELANPSWREDPAAVERLVRRYREMDETSDPAAVERRQAATRQEAEVRLRRLISRARRPGVGPTLRLSAAYLPLRGTGKSATGQCIDVARRAARFLGRELASTGALAEPEDVWFLQAGELESPPPDAAGLVDVRRERHDHFAGLEMPDLWQGIPTPLPVGPADANDGPVEGAGVSPGVREGVARVILDPSEGDQLEPGEIIVCVSTDPSWASLFLLAEAIVIDIGGPLSHGAIVARELGIPCVIGTRSGTKRISSGSRIRVDGSAGTVDSVGGV